MEQDELLITILYYTVCKILYQIPILYNSYLCVYDTKYNQIVSVLANKSMLENAWVLEYVCVHIAWKYTLTKTHHCTQSLTVNLSITMLPTQMRELQPYAQKAHQACGRRDTLLCCLTDISVTLSRIFLLWSQNWVYSFFPLFHLNWRTSFKGGLPHCMCVCDFMWCGPPWMLVWT